VPPGKKNLKWERRLILAALAYATAVFTFTALEYISDRPPKPKAPPKAFVPPPGRPVEIPEAPTLPPTPLPALPPLPDLPKR